MLQLQLWDGIAHFKASPKMFEKVLGKSGSGFATFVHSLSGLCYLPEEEEMVVVVVRDLRPNPCRPPGHKKSASLDWTLSVPAVVGKGYRLRAVRYK